jgi:hypothetical protein
VRKAIADKREIDLRALGDFYAESTVQAADFYDRIARETLGRSPAHVLLMHETDLTRCSSRTWSPRCAPTAGRSSRSTKPSPTRSRSRPDTLVLGGGRVSALAAAAGRDPATLGYERNNEAVLARLFEERVIKKGVP